MMEWLISAWVCAFCWTGFALAVEVAKAKWALDRERRAWRTMLHNRRVNERAFYLYAKSKIMRRRG